MKYYKIIPYEVSNLKELEKPIQISYNKSIGKIESRYLIELKKSIKQTDFIYLKNLPFGYIVSPKLKKILEKHKLPASQFYPIPVLKENKIKTHYWLHWILDFKTYADFEKLLLNGTQSKDVSFDIIDFDCKEKEVFFSERLVKYLTENNINSIIFKGQIEIEKVKV